MKRLVVVGYTDVMAGVLAGRVPDGSVTWIDEPDVIAKRELVERTASKSMTARLVPFEYQRPGAAKLLLPLLEESDEVVAVMPALEYAVVTAAELAAELGLPGATPPAAVVLRDKRLVRRISRAAGVANPRQRQAHGPADVARALADWGTGVVVKPANRQGSVGTELVHPGDDVAQVWARCELQDEGIMVPDRMTAAAMLVEELVEGREFSVEALVRDGVCEFASTTAKYLFDGRRPIEQGHVVPATVPAPERTALIDATVALVEAVGFRDGVVHGEWIVRDGVPHLVECAGRLPGDGIVQLVDLAWEGDLVGGWLEILSAGAFPAAGPFGNDLTPVPPRAAAVWFGAFGPGTVESVAPLDPVLEAPGVVRAVLEAEPGAELPALSSSWDRQGFVMTSGADPDPTLARARELCDALPLVLRRPGLSPAPLLVPAGASS